MERKNVAIYLDFENLAISAETIYPSQKTPLNPEAILAFASEKGFVSVRKAYADWSMEIFALYQTALLEQGFELIHLPGTNLQGKNGSDVRLSIDVMEDLVQFPQLDTLIIGSGDSDFIPLIQRIRMRGKASIVIGFEHSASKLIKKNGAEFYGLDQIAPNISERSSQKFRQILLAYIQAHKPEEHISLSKLRTDLGKINPDYLTKIGNDLEFKQMLQTLQGDLVRQLHSVGKKSQLSVQLQAPTPPSPIPQSNHHQQAQQFLQRKLRYLKNPQKRKQLVDILYKAIQGQDSASIQEIVDQLSTEQHDYSKAEIKKYVNTLFTGGAFDFLQTQSQTPLLLRSFTLSDSIKEAEDMDHVYIKRVSQILQNRYPDLSSHEILDLLL